MQSILGKRAAACRGLRARAAHDQGAAAGYLLKAAGDTVSAMSLSGRLILSRSGWGLLEVPNALVRGLFAALDEPGVRLPTKDGVLNAHISVFRKEEVAQVGAEKITEWGRRFRYQIGPIQTVQPRAWDGVSRCWMVRCDAPELKALRKTYGLTPLPNGDHEFHVTIAVRPTGVLGPNAVSKAAASPAGVLVGAGLGGLGGLAYDHLAGGGHPLQAALAGAGLGGVAGHLATVTTATEPPAPEPQLSQTGMEPQSLADNISRWYSRTPGGLDAVARRAIRARNEVPGFGSLVFTRGHLDEKFPIGVTEEPGIDGRARPVLRPGSAGPFQDEFGNVGDLGAEVAIRPGLGPRIAAKAKEHELSHAALDILPTIDKMKETGAFRPFKPNMPDDYFASPAELVPRLADIKRRYAYAHGKDVTTPEEAGAALDWWYRQIEKHPMETRYTDHRGPMRWQQKSREDPGFREMLKKIMPQLVMGAHAGPGAKAATVGPANDEPDDEADREDCPECGAVLERDPYDGTCNGCGHAWGPKSKQAGIGDLFKGLAAKAGPAAAKIRANPAAIPGAVGGFVRDQTRHAAGLLPNQGLFGSPGQNLATRGLATANNARKAYFAPRYPILDRPMADVNAIKAHRLLGGTGLPAGVAPRVLDRTRSAVGTTLRYGGYASIPATAIGAYNNAMNNVPYNFGQAAAKATGATEAEAEAAGNRAVNEIPKLYPDMIRGTLGLGGDQSAIAKMHYGVARDYLPGMARRSLYNAHHGDRPVLKSIASGLRMATPFGLTGYVAGRMLEDPTEANLPKIIRDNVREHMPEMRARPGESIDSPFASAWQRTLLPMSHLPRAATDPHTVERLRGVGFTPEVEQRLGDRVRTMAADGTQKAVAQAVLHMPKPGQPAAPAAATPAPAATTPTIAQLATRWAGQGANRGIATAWANPDVQGAVLDRGRHVLRWGAGGAALGAVAGLGVGGIAARDDPREEHEKRRRKEIARGLLAAAGVGAGAYLGAQHGWAKTSAPNPEGA